MSSDNRHSAARFRQRAKELRAISKQVDDKKMKQTLLDVAEEYEGMAKARESDKPK